MLVHLLLACAASDGTAPERPGASDTGASDPDGPADTAEPDDTAGCGTSGDTGTTRSEGPVTFEDTDSTCDRVWMDADAVGCGWGYVYVQQEDRVLTLSLDLPEEDLAADHDWVYTLSVGAQARLVVVELDGGTDLVNVWSCSDYMEAFEGTSFEGVAGTIEVESRWVCDTTDPSCYDEEVEAHAVVRLRDVALQSSTGACASLPDAEYRVLLGWTDCGG